MITLTFANGLRLENLELNGTVYVSKKRIDPSVFTPEALRSMTELDTETGYEYTFHDVVFVGQREEDDGWHLDFYEKSWQEKQQEHIAGLELSNQYSFCKFDGIKYIADPERPIPLTLPMRVIRNMIYLYGGVRYVALKDGTAAEAEFDDFFAEY